MPCPAIELGVISPSIVKLHARALVFFPAAEVLQCRASKRLLGGWRALGCSAFGHGMSKIPHGFAAPCPY
jgi:hypothetical protein